MKQSHNIALILAGGTGERMHASVPKQFMEIDGESVLDLVTNLQISIRIENTYGWTIGIDVAKINAIPPFTIDGLIAAYCHKITGDGVECFIGKEAISVAEVEEYAKLPSKEVLISKLLFMLQSPMQRLAIAASEIAKKKDITIRLFSNEH